VAVSDTTTDYTAKWAIIIGIDAYAPGSGLDPLSFAANDATALRDVLRDEFGFAADHIKCFIDKEARGDEIRAAFLDWAADSKVPGPRPSESDAVLIFYAGHGVIGDVPGNGGRTSEWYLAPVNSHLSKPRELLSETWIRTQLQRIAARHKLVILDSCYSGVLFAEVAVRMPPEREATRLQPPPPVSSRAASAVGRGRPTPASSSQGMGASAPRLDLIRDYLKEPAFLAISAGRETPVSDGDGINRHSVFTRALLELLAERADSTRPDQVFTSRELATRLEARVRDALDSAQVPDWGRLGPGQGDFVFRPVVWRMTPSEESRRRQYSLSMEAARQAVSDRNVIGLRAALEDLRPNPGQDDLRGFEWFLLWRMAHPARWEFNGHQKPVIYGTLTPDGKTLVSIDQDNIVKFWDIETGRIRLTQDRRRGESLPGPEFSRETIAAPVVSGMEAVWATADETGKATVFDLKSGAERATLVSPGIGEFSSTETNAMAFSPDGTLLACAATGMRGSFVGVSRTRLWNWGQGQDTVDVPVDGQVSSIAFARGGAALVVATQNQLVSVWDISTLRKSLPSPRAVADLKQLKRLDQFENVISLAADDDAKHVALGTDSGSCLLLDTAKGSLSGVKIKSYSVNSLALSPDGRFVAVAVGDGTVQILRAEDLHPVRILSGHRGPAISVSYSKDGRLLSSTGIDGRVLLWDLKRSDSPMETVPALATRVYEVLASPSKQRLVTAGEGVRFQLWDIEGTQPIHLAELVTEGAPWRAFAFSPDGSLFASSFGASGRELRIWETRKGTQLAQLDTQRFEIRSLAFTHDGTSLAVGCSDGSILTWKRHGDEWDGLGILKGRLAPASAAAFAPDMRTLAVGGTLNDSSAAVELWDVDRQSVRKTLMGPRGEVRTLTYSRDGQMLAATDAVDALHLWTNEENHTRRWHQPGDSLVDQRMQSRIPQQVLFAPSSRYIAWLGAGFLQDVSLQVFEARTARLIASRGGISPITSLALSAGGRSILTGEASKIRFWDPVTLEQRLELQVPTLTTSVHILATTGDDRKVFVGGQDGSLTILTAAPAEETIGPVDRLSRALSDADPQVRRNAAEGYSWSGPGLQTAVWTLSKALEDTDEVRAAALRKLITINGDGPETLRFLTDALRMGAPSVRREAIEVLATRGAAADRWIPDLLGIIRHGDLLNTCRAYHAIKTIDFYNIEALPLLFTRMGELSGSDSPYVEKTVVAVLKEVFALREDSREVVPGLAEGLKSARSARVSDAMLNALSTLGPDAQEAVPLLRDRLVGRQAHASAVALSLIASSDAVVSAQLVPYFMRRLGGPRDWEWRQSIRALGRLAPAAEVAVPTLEHALQTVDDSQEKAEVGLALRQIREPMRPSVDVLIDALKDESESLRGVAINELLLLGRRATKAVPELESLGKNDPEDGNRVQARRAIFQIQGQLGMDWMLVRKRP
jgi:WD40 repeat protein/HEAT repeat protein